MHRIKKDENLIWTGGFLLLLAVVIGLRYDYYYDLNDDVTMKDIVSGIYTGSPEGRSLQMLYPLGAVIALAYRAFPGLPVYGIVLWLCQYGCIGLVVHRSLQGIRSRRGKLLLLGGEGILILSLLSQQLIFVQYTFTAAMLAAAAAFLFITQIRTIDGLEEGGQKTGGIASFLKNNLVSVLLAWLSYLFRTELLLLMLPFFAVAGLYRWSLEEKIFTRTNVSKYFSIIGGILAGMLIFSLADTAAYSSAEWKEFLHFFERRTEVYDFQGIPSYEGNEELYHRLEITESEQNQLLSQYNFGLQEAVDAELLDEIATYQAQKKQENTAFIPLLVEKIRLSLYRTFHKTADDYPWNLAVVLGYLGVAVVMILTVWKENSVWGLWKRLWKLVLLYGVRMALWLFILVKGRDPVRITHSLYLMEFCILAGMLQMECCGWWMDECPTKSETRKGGLARITRLIAGSTTGRRIVSSVVPLALILLLLVTLPQRIQETDRAFIAREAAAAVDREWKEYCGRHPENFYFMDVYSSVSYPMEPYASTPYSEKLFAGTPQRVGNYDLMGGWLVKSPLYRQKLEQFGIPSMEEGLLDMEQVYLMVELEKGTEELGRYFADQNIEVRFTLTDEICGLLGVYQVERLEKEGKSVLR
ncbi:MAG: hypothetical protein IKM28_10495 [Lachnospiraceae bacterium]|nr:hypothetical protein [Lachnospiraceae bacterium]